MAEATRPLLHVGHLKVAYPLRSTLLRRRIGENVAVGDVTFDVELNVALREQLSAGVFDVAFVAAEHGLHAQQQLLHRERLGHVVVGAELEALHAIAFFAARGDHDDRHTPRVVLAHQPRDFAAGDVGQHQVEQNQVGFPRASAGDAGGSLLSRHVLLEDGRYRFNPAVRTRCDAEDFLAHLTTE